MGKRLIVHVRNQWMGALALLLVLSGGGYAIAGGGPLNKKQKAQATSIAQAQIKQAAPTLEVARAENAGQAEKAVDATMAGTSNTATSANFAQTAGSATTSVLGGLGRMGSNDSCDPPVANAVACTTVTMTLPVPGRVLVTATGRGVDGGDGLCVVGTTAGSVTGTGQTVHTPAVGGENFSILGVTGVFPAGTHSFGLDCAELSINNTFRVLDARVAAVALGQS